MREMFDNFFSHLSLAMLILAALASGVAGSLPSQSVDWMVGAHAVDYQAKISTATGIGPKGAKRLTIGTPAWRSFFLIAGTRNRTSLQHL